MEKIIIDKNLAFAIKFKWKEGDTSLLDFEAVEVIAVGKHPDFKIEFGGFVELNNMDFDKAYENDPMFNGYIKWDGCMQIHNFNHHFCGYSTMMQDIMYTIYSGAKFILGDNLDDDLANTKNI